MVRTAKELHAAAVDLVNQGKLTAAARALAMAADRADDDDLRARIDGTIALASAGMGWVSDAEELCAEVLSRPALSEETRTILMGQMGSIVSFAGRLDEADAWLTQAIDAMAESVERANLLMNRAMISIQRRKLTAARDDTALAAATFAAQGMVVDEAEARHDLGYIALLNGDIVTALGDMGRARAGFVGVSPVVTAIGDVDRAEVLRDAGLTAEAEQILEASAAVFGRQRMPQSRAETEVALARSQLTHAPAAAARTAAVAARRFRKLGNETWAARADAVRVRAQLATDVYDTRGGKAPVAAHALAPEEIESVASSLHKAGLRADAVSVRLAGQLRAARDAAQGNRQGDQRSTAVRVPPNAPIDVRLLASEVRVARAAAARREADVRRHAAAGLDELEQWQLSFGSLDLQAAISMHAVPLLMGGLSSALRSGRPHLVFEWSERARHTAQQVVPLRPPPDQETAEALAELRMLRAEGGDGAWLSSPRAAELHEWVRERQWSSTGVASVEERMSLAQLQGALDDETALLSYVWSESVLACLVATSRDAQVVPLPGWPAARAMLGGLRADLDVSASVRSGPMGAVVRRSLDERLAALSQRLLDAPVAVADRRRLVITTPGVLAGIPWAMLPGMRGRVFTLAPSATRWARRGSLVDDRLSAGIAVGPRVARGDEEADAAAAAWMRAGRDVALVRGAAATVDAVAELASEVSVLHVAAHGRHASDNPLFSGLELADGALFGYDIDRIPRPPETVVLSACEVGRSSVRWGEEAIGMTRTWLHAGTRCVIAAPVIVADDVACELLGAVHTGLAAGEPPAEALAAASLATGLVAPFECHGAGF
ncbi:MAG: CHAT domain-containing protein [Microbacterium sp.]|uniref:CHAT domain-containing protein n=1 Tax=Microbacterium sp. TaxID=51671 RepID=UPI0039E63E85